MFKLKLFLGLLLGLFPYQYVVTYYPMPVFFSPLPNLCSLLISLANTISVVEAYKIFIINTHVYTPRLKCMTR